MVAAGLASGAVAALAIIAAVALLVPDPASSPSPGPSASSIAGASPTPGGPPSPAASTPTTSPSTAPSGSAPFGVGEPAPPLRVEQLGGGEIDLAALRGRPVWINIMATWCPECRDEFPVMNRFADRYAETGLVVIAIDTREDAGTVAAFVASVSATFPVGLDLDGSVADAWDAVVLPVHFWIDRDGIIRAGALGGIGPDLMAENLATILPEVVVEP